MHWKFDEYIYIFISRLAPWPFLVSIYYSNSIDFLLSSNLVTEQVFFTRVQISPFCILPCYSQYAHTFSSTHTRTPLCCALDWCFFGVVWQARNKPADGHTPTAGAKGSKGTPTGQKPSTKPTAQKGQVKAPPKAPPSANKPNKKNKKNKHQQHDLVVTIDLVSTKIRFFNLQTNYSPSLSFVIK